MQEGPKTSTVTGYRRQWGFMGWKRLPFVYGWICLYCTGKSGCSASNLGHDFDTTVTWRYVITWSGTATDTFLMVFPLYVCIDNCNIGNPITHTVQVQYNTVPVLYVLWIIQYFSLAIQWLCTICLCREKHLAVWWMSGGSIQQGVVQMKAQMSNACKREPFSFRPFRAPPEPQFCGDTAFVQRLRAPSSPARWPHGKLTQHQCQVTLACQFFNLYHFIPHHFELCH